MNGKVTTVTVSYQNIDGYHFFSTDDVKGLFIGSTDLKKAFHDVCPVIERLMEANHKISCTAQPLMSFQEFLESTTDGAIKEDAQSRTFALQMAA